MQSFYHVEIGGEIKNLVKNSHALTYTEVLDQHSSRMFVSSPDTDASTGNETPASIIKRFKEYDEYELDDIVFSRLVVESCVSARLRLEVETRFSHMEDFDDLPGQVYFMLVLDTCHASAASDIGSKEQL